MPGFNVADGVTRLIRRVNFVGLPHHTGMQKPRHSAQPKAWRRHGFGVYLLTEPVRRSI